MVDDVVAYLRSKGLRTYKAKGAEVTVQCLWCAPGHGGAKGKGKLYVNTETWLYYCHVCEATGGKKSLLDHYGDGEKYVPEPGIPLSVKIEAMSDYADLCHQMLAENPLVLNEHLLSRGLTMETIIERRLGYHPKGLGVTSSIVKEDGTPKYSRAVWEATGLLYKGREFLRGMITIPYYQSGQVVQVRGKLPGGRYFTPPDQPTRLYGSDDARDAEKIVVCEGEFDKMMLEQALRETGEAEHLDYGIVAVSGAKTWVNHTQVLEDYRVVLIGFDPDEAGRTQAEKLREELGPKARIVNLPRQVLRDSQDAEVRCDWNEYLRPLDEDHPFGGHDGFDAYSLLVRAEMEGKMLFSASDVVQEWASAREAPSIKTGFAALDLAISPGLYPGSVTIPIAKAGSGKSIFLSNLAMNMANRRVLHITLENTKAQIAEHMVRIARFENPLMEPAELARMLPDWQVYDGNRLPVERIGELIDLYAEERGDAPEVLLLDHLAYLAHGQRGDNAYQKTSNAVFLLKEIAKEYGLVVVCPHQASRRAERGEEIQDDMARDSGTVEETADFMLSLWRPSQSKLLEVSTKSNRRTEDGKLMVSVLKSRTGGAGVRFPLRVSAMSLRILDESAPARLLARIDHENADWNRGVPYDVVQRRQRQEALGAAQGAF